MNDDGVERPAKTELREPSVTDKETTASRTRARHTNSMNEQADPETRLSGLSRGGAKNRTKTAASKRKGLADDRTPVD